MGTYKVQDETGPWWVVGTFDAAWSVVRVRAVAERGEALVDNGAVKVLRLLDEPFADWREASLVATRLERAYAGKTRLGKLGRPDREGVTRRTVMALHVDRNPPNSENRPVPVEGPGLTQRAGERSGFINSRELKATHETSQTAASLDAKLAALKPQPKPKWKLPAETIEKMRQAALKREAARRAARRN